MLVVKCKEVCFTTLYPISLLLCFGFEPNKKEEEEKQIII